MKNSPSPGDQTGPTERKDARTQPHPGERSTAPSSSKGASASRRADAEAKQGEPQKANGRSERSPKQENL